MKLIRRFFSYYRPHRRLFIVDLICSFTISVCNLFYPMIARNIMNDYVPNQNLRLLIVWAIVLAAIYAVKSVLTFIVGYWGHVLGVRIQGDMRRDLFRHIETQPFSFFDENKTGGIMSRIINDLFEVSELAHHGPEDVFNSFISIVGALIMLCTINGWLALIVLCYIPFMLFFAIKARGRMNKAFEESRKKVAEINAEIESSVSGVRITKAYNAENTEEKKFDVVNGRFKKARAESYRAMGMFQGGMSAFNDFLYLLALVSGGLLFYFDVVTGADFTAYILYITMLLNPLRTLVTLFEQIQDGMTGFKRFCELMDMPSEYQPERPVETDLDGDIVFDDVTFAYDDGEPVLSSVSFTAREGEVTALVGPSGSGKSTAAKLAARFWDVDGGTVTVGGVDVSGIDPETLLTDYTEVFQDVVLFNGTVMENIRLGRRDATDEEVLAAARAANCDEFVQKMPQGYATPIGENGALLSGGERQRISIARAILKDAPIVLLDEATASLDVENESAVQQALSRLLVGKTVLVIAHRMRTVMGADHVVVLAEGRVAEDGTPAELLAAGGLFARMASLQGQSADWKL